MDKLYQQCLLCKGSKMLTSWLPLKFTKVKKIVSLKVDGEWSDGWNIVTAFGIKVTEDNLNMLKNQHRYNREETDV